MDQSTYDVFKGTPEKKPLWLGAIVGLQRATEQMSRIAARMPGDYFVFDPAANKVVASVQSNASISAVQPSRPVIGGVQ